jgi:hypothetical protein
LMHCYQVIFMFTPQGSGMQVALSTSRTADRPGGATGRRRPAREPNKDGVAMSGPEPPLWGVTVYDPLALDSLDYNIIN